MKRYNPANPRTPSPQTRLHDLRHIHATTLRLAGVPVHVVAARLGHADPSITLRVYAHVIRAAEALAAEVFTKAMDEWQAHPAIVSIDCRCARPKSP
ncbi:tyrosine-type recombinase/integrase [Nonomuraea spiralis]|uniref:tyrosine-type recombinase/integrase n=1 Tax=Nonomuraea TaxID=83681 RepID=UPI0021AD8D7F|nr:tyrosine-type recombinase/integrase [Nonomuraea sp. WAC 01424]